MHDNALNERGVTTSIETYAQILTGMGHIVSIAFRSDNPSNVPEVVERIGQQFELLPYQRFSKVQNSQHNFDLAYFQKSGARDDNCLKIPSVIHVVFQEYDPHGQSYIYISKWLANQMKSEIRSPKNVYRGLRARINGCSNALKFDYLPLSSNVDLLDDSRDRNRFVLLRYGGNDSFDIPWVQNELINFVQTHPNAIAFMVNTNQFVDHERIRFLPKFTNATERNHLLSSCDVFLHARYRGESFGLAVVEAMQAGKPILSWSGGIDSHHVELLSGSGCLFSNRQELSEKLHLAYGGFSIANTDLLIDRSEQFRNQNIAPKLENLIQSALTT